MIVRCFRCLLHRFIVCKTEISIGGTEGEFEYKVSLGLQKGIMRLTGSRSSCTRKNSPMVPGPATLHAHARLPAVGKTDLSFCVVDNGEGGEGGFLEAGTAWERGVGVPPDNGTRFNPPLETRGGLFVPNFSIDYLKFAYHRAIPQERCFVIWQRTVISPRPRSTS